MTTTANIVRRGDGLPLIAIHGMGVDHRLLLPLDDCLSAGGRWERIYLDLPGFGRTPALAGVGGLPEIAVWLREVVGELVGDSPFALVGSSLGGLLARHLATQLPDQVLGLALIAPVVEPDFHRRRKPPRTVLATDANLIATLTPSDAEEFQSIAVLQTATEWERFRTSVLPGIRAADPDAVDRLARRYVLPSTPDEMSVTFTGPCVVVTGRQDHIVGFEDQLSLLRTCSHATLVTIDRAGHNVHLEQPALVRPLIHDWLHRMQLEMEPS